jgi:hypothetical protein
MKRNATRELVQLAVTTGALAALEKARQQRDHVLLAPRSRRVGQSATTKFAPKANALGGSRLLRSYCIGEKQWVIIEADRAVTTILLPEDY